MSSEEEALARAIMELQGIEKAISELQSLMATLRAALNEFESAMSLLEELAKHKEGIMVLVPIGGGNLLRAEIKEVNTIRVNLGAGVIVEETLEKSQEIMRKRRENLMKSIELHENRILQYARRAEELRRLVEALSARIRERQRQPHSS
ncbi:MAG: prefoldin subunit alpha [Nitrososphaerota archaeon]|nr:prefoldin subunit alpha [Nitrososphaerota archaeon]